jgi:hypothetical protein
MLRGTTSCRCAEIRRGQAEFRRRSEIRILLIRFAAPEGRLRQFSNLNQQCEPAASSGVFRRGNNKGEKAMPTMKRGSSKRGFAAMDPAKQREIASKGGKASHGGGRKAASAR